MTEDAQKALLKVLRMAEQMIDCNNRNRRVRPNMWRTIASLTKAARESLAKAASEAPPENGR
jgi:Trp operon repressor